MQIKVNIVNHKKKWKNFLVNRYATFKLWIFFLSFRLLPLEPEVSLKLFDIFKSILIITDIRTTSLMFIIHCKKLKFKQTKYGRSVKKFIVKIKFKTKVKISFTIIIGLSQVPTQPKKISSCKYINIHMGNINCKLNKLI